MNRTIPITTVEYKDIIEVDNDGQIDGRCSVRGDSASLGNMIIGAVRDYYNCTLIAERMIGELDHSTGLYSGAIGIVQKNEADFLMTAVYYPLPSNGQDSFDYVPINVEDTMMLASLYNYTTEFDSKDVIDMMTGFEATFFWSALLSFYAMYLTLKTGLFISRVLSTDLWPKVRAVHKRRHRRSKRESSSHLWLMTRAFLLEDNFPSSNSVYKIVSMATCSYVFFYSSYMLNSMSTDLVVVRDPIVISSYQDILDRNGVKVFWATFTTDFQLFRDAQSGTVESKLWSRKHLLNYDGQNTFFTDAMKLQSQIVEQRMAFIAREPLVRFGIALTFTFARRFGYDLSRFRALMVKDGNSKSYPKTILLRKEIDPIVKDLLSKRIQLMCERGFYDGYYSRIVSRTSDGAGMMDLFRSSSGRIMKPPSHEPRIGLSNTKKLFLLLFHLFCIDTLVLVLEICRHKMRIRSKIKRKKKS